LLWKTWRNPSASAHLGIPALTFPQENEAVGAVSFYLFLWLKIVTRRIIATLRMKMSIAEIRHFQPLQKVSFSEMLTV
jgi:hypothetical protein